MGDDGATGGAEGRATREARVGLVLPSFGSGGAERVVLNLAAGLAGRGWTVRLLVLDGRGPMRDRVPPGVAIVDLDRARARRAGPALVAELRRRPVDLLVGSQTHVNVLLGMLRPLLPHTTRLALREPNLRPAADPRSLRHRAIGRVLGRADLVIASSPAMREHLVASVRGRARVQVLPNPVDVDALRSQVAADAATRHGPWGPQERTIRLVTVGRLTGQKAHDELLRALAHVDAPLTLAVLGDGPLRAPLEALARELGLVDRVRFLGRVDDPRDLTGIVASADAMVHPARYDGMPNAVLEALALGTPVIATSDLRVLHELADEVGPQGLRLVPRDDLPEVLGAVAVRSSRHVLGASLLPDRFRLPDVVDALLDAVPAGARARGA